MRRQICVAATADAAAFGRRPVLFRPPYGGTNAVVRRAAVGCGMRAVVLWDVTVNRGRCSTTQAAGTCGRATSC